jgi:arabinan endo-1,5-alpha-L-arabinosidase
MSNAQTPNILDRLGRGIAAGCFVTWTCTAGCTENVSRSLDPANGTSQVPQSTAVASSNPSGGPSGSTPVAAASHTGTASAHATSVPEVNTNASSASPSPSSPAPGSSVPVSPGSATASAATGTGVIGTPDASSQASASASSAAPDDAAVPDDDLCHVGVYDGTTPKVLELSGDTFAHDPTMIEANGTFYRFWTGDNLPTASGPELTEWTNGPAVYRNGYPTWATDWLADKPDNTFNFPWAPDVSYFGGKYHLYGSFSAFFGRNVSCINHLTTSDIAAGDWVDQGPVICTDGTQDYNAIDPDVGVDAAGNAWLAFGSFWDGIQAFPLDASGNREGNTLTRLAWAEEIEAPVLFRRCGYYYLFVSWGLCCPGEGRSVEDLSYRVVVGRSENILGPYLDREGTPLLEGGGTPVVSGDGVNFAAAGHSDVIVSGSKVYHLYHAYLRSNGNATLRIAEMPFDEQGWPVPGGP